MLITRFFSAGLVGPSFPADLNSSIAVTGISIYPDSVIRDYSNSGIGISLNPFTEHGGIVRARSFSEAAMEMKLKSLRWPEGELGESILWSLPPYKTSNLSPTMRGGVWPYNNTTVFDTVTGKPKPMLNFDQFIRLCRQIGAEPFVIIPIDAVQKPDGVHSYVSEEEILRNAVEMVRYSKAKGYKVKYWEIGNENDMEVSGTKSKQRWQAPEYANFVVKISRLMKAQDSEIYIGANGMTTMAWWETVLKTASAEIDFLVTHQYYNSKRTKTVSDGNWYNNYRIGLSKKWNFIQNITNVSRAIDQFAPEKDKKRLKIAVTETSAYSGEGDIAYYPEKNNFGTSLITFDTMGEMLANPRMLYAHYWTSHWFGKSSIHNALGPDNEILPTGRAIQLWNEAILKNRVKATPDGYSLPEDNSIYAFCDGNKLNILLVNRGEAPASIPLQFKNWNGKNKSTKRIVQFKGTGPEDLTPSYGQIADLKTDMNGSIEVGIPPYSITLLSF